jgi:predicted DNA-binding transcriptional regulator YafY
MKLTVAARLLRLLDSKPEGALTVKQISERWMRQTEVAMPVRNVQRYMSELSADSADGPALVDVLDGEKERRYYLRLSQVAQWFMTEEAALATLLTRQVLERSFATLNTKNTKTRSDIADAVAGADLATRRLRARLRIVPDGLGRMPARIEPDALASLVDAIGADQKVGFNYVNAAGKSSRQVCSPLGLVAKDGTIYLLATSGPSDAPRHFALHRLDGAHMLPHRAAQRPDFDLDRYIHDTHQLSHPLDADAPPIALKLRVSPETLYHFSERPLSSNQSIGPAVQPGGWHVVTAKVPETVLLVPFLMSMGPGVEVLGPKGLREKTAQWLHKTCAHYESGSQG